VRRSLPRIPLLRLCSALRDELDESAEDLDIEEQIGSLETAEYLHRKGMARGRPVRVHIKVDTGMGRSCFSLTRPRRSGKSCTCPGSRSSVS
jgi:alanine racemase